LGILWSCHKGLLQLKEHFKPEDEVVVLFHDSGTLCRKMFNDDLRANVVSEKK
jgi:cystathionine beta-synthase